MLKIQEFLLTHSLKDLAENHGVYARFSTKNPLKFSLNYDQIEARSGDKMAEEARGLILATQTPIASELEIVGPTRVLAYPFNRFYNAGDPNAAQIDWQSARVYTKLDGTLCICYFDEQLNQWCVATRQVPDADVPFDSTGRTFRDLFDDALKQTAKLDDIGEYILHKKETYMFELCTPENQQVVKHAKYSLTLLGARNIKTLQEVPVEQLRGWFDIVQSHKLSDFDSCLAWVESQPAAENEGLVVCDSNFNRIKIKSTAYKAAHRLKDKTSNSPRAILELILLEQDDDVRDLLDDRMKKVLADIKEGLRLLLHKLQLEFDENFSDNRKEFAIAIQRGSGLLGPQMWCWQNKKPHHDWLKSLAKNGQFPDSSLDSVLDMIKKYNKEEATNEENLFKYN